MKQAVIDALRAAEESFRALPSHQGLHHADAISAVLAEADKPAPESSAKQQALAQVASITTMVAALECDFDRLEALCDERDEWVSDHVYDTEAEGRKEWADAHQADAQELTDLEEAAGEHEDRDSALQAIHEDPLSVEVRSDWASLGETLNPGEFRIVLCTGGPHVELQGDLQDGEPCSVRVLYRDWGDSGELFDFDRDVVLAYCQRFSFGQ